MSISIKVSGEKYEQFKIDVLEQVKLTRIDVDSKDIQFDSLYGIAIRGTIIKLEKTALASLTKALGLSKVFVDTLSSTYGNDSGILAEIVKAVQGKKSKSFTFIYDRRDKTFTNVYVKETKLISDHQYFETLEKVIAKTPGAFLRSIEQDSNGDLKATISNPKLEFDYNKFADEVFIGGMTLELTPSQMLTTFFTERLVCTNGMVADRTICSQSVEVKEKVPDFMAAILDSSYHINSIAEFKKRLHRCYNTTASLREVLATEKRVRQILGDTACADGLISDMSSNHLKDAFGHAYMDKKDVHKFLNTDMTLWDLVNETTAVSAAIEQRGLPVSEKQNRSIQMLGGDRMFKVPDLAPNNIVQKYK